DRQVVEGVGEYLQASQSEWDIFIEEDFRARIDNIKEWLGDGVETYTAGAIDVALFVLIIGGFLGVVNKTGAIDAGIERVTIKLN
ncbi:hypothetical protein MJO10_30920, partial [Salmonella enterica subsp. enterica serovar Anatum]|nr:hypothetical protein [Salmonella enterica subsp. enterica serovar Anatum]